MRDKQVYAHFSVRVPIPLRTRVRVYAATSGYKIEAIVRLALEQYLKNRVP